MKYNQFFGSKLNTVLLLVLIVLMVFALRFMWQNQQTYINPILRVDNSDGGGAGTRPALEGNSADLVSFSVAPGQEVSGIVNATGSVKNGYFFEGNILVNILDQNKKLLKAGHGTATSEWMTAGPVTFNAKLDFTGLQKGVGFIEIRNDNPSDLRSKDKSIYIPVVIN